MGFRPGFLEGRKMGKDVRKGSALYRREEARVRREHVLQIAGQEQDKLNHWNRKYQKAKAQVPKAEAAVRKAESAYNRAKPEARQKAMRALHKARENYRKAVSNQDAAYRKAMQVKRAGEARIAKARTEKLHVDMSGF